MCFLTGAPDLSKASSQQPRRVTRFASLLGGDETDDVRFRLHLPNDLADLFPRQLRLGEADAVELAVQRSLNHGGLVGTKKFGDLIRARLRGKAHDHIGTFARRAGKLGSALEASTFKPERQRA